MGIRKLIIGGSSLLSETRNLIQAVPAVSSDRKRVDRKIRKLKNKGYWGRIDRLFYFGIKDSDGACLNWKNPLGGNNLLQEGYGRFNDLPSLIDEGKGNFSTGVEDWKQFGNNLVTANNGILSIEYVDNSSGGYCLLNQVNAISQDLEIGKSYTLKLKVKVNTGSVTLRVYDGTELGSVSFSNTEFEWKEIRFVAVSTTGASIRCSSMSYGEVLYIDEYNFRQQNIEGNAYGTNLLEQINDGKDCFQRCTYVDNGNGFLLGLCDSYGLLTTDLTVGQAYRFKCRVRSAGGDGFRPRIFAGVATWITGDDITSVDWVEWETVFVAEDPTSARFQLNGFAAGDIMEIDYYEVTEWSNLTAVNGPTFTEYSDFTGDGVAAYLDFNVSLDTLENYSVNNGTIGVKIVEDVAENKTDIGVYDGTNWVQIASKLLTGVCQSRINMATPVSDYNSNAEGNYAMVRSAVDQWHVRKDGSNFTLRNSASTGIPSGKSLMGLCYNNSGSSDGFSNKGIGYLYIGDAFSDSEIDDISDILNG